MWLPLVHPQLGTWPMTQACSLTGNRISDPLVRRLVLSPLSYTSHGSWCLCIVDRLAAAIAEPTGGFIGEEEGPGRNRHFPYQQGKNPLLHRYSLKELVSTCPGGALCLSQAYKYHSTPQTHLGKNRACLLWVTSP